MPASTSAVASQASPITFSYSDETAAATGPIAPWPCPLVPPSRSRLNAHVNTSMTVRTRNTVRLQSCALAQCAIVGGTPESSVTPTST